MFTALREITAALGCADPHLGLYGAFGYDLAFQFEPVRLRLDRPATQRDLVLHLPDEIWVLDRKREEAVRYSYDFEVGGVSTAGLGRQTASTGRGAGTAARSGSRTACRSRGRGAMRGSWRRPGSGSPAGTCSRSCPATCSTAGARRRPRSTNCCGSATRPRTSSCSTWARGSTWSARHPRCTSGSPETGWRPARSRARSRAARTPSRTPRTSPPCSARPRRSPS